MLRPYEIIDADGVSKPSGTAVVVAIACRNRTFIKKLILARQSGSGDVTVELFSVNPTTLAAVTEEPLYRISPAVASTSGVSEQHFEHGRIVSNHDSLNNNNQQPDFVYLRLSGSGTGVWGYCLGGYSGV